MSMKGNPSPLLLTPWGSGVAQTAKYSKPTSKQIPAGKATLSRYSDVSFLKARCPRMLNTLATR